MGFLETKNCRVFAKKIADCGKIGEIVEELRKIAENRRKLRKCYIYYCGKIADVNYTPTARDPEAAACLQVLVQTLLALGDPGAVLGEAECRVAHFGDVRVQHSLPPVQGHLNSAPEVDVPARQAEKALGSYLGPKKILALCTENQENPISIPVPTQPNTVHHKERNSPPKHVPYAPKIPCHANALH